MTPLLLAETATPELIGHRADGTPILLHYGYDWPGMVAEPDEPEGGDEPDGDAEDEPVEGDADYVPPDKATWQRTQAGLKRNNAENRRLRALRRAATAAGLDLSNDDGLKALEERLKGGAAATGDKAGAGSGAAVTRATERAIAKTEAKYRPVIIDMALKNALTDAGWTGDGEARIKSMLDMDDVDIVDGKVVGLDEQIAEIAGDIPHWFNKNSGGQKRTQRRGAAEVDGGARATKSAASTKSWLDKVDDQMTGRR